MKQRPHHMQCLCFVYCIWSGNELEYWTAVDVMRANAVPVHNTRKVASSCTECQLQFSVT
jgi:hypothetical protein